ncbi:MAG: hypothetical protein ACLS3M_09305 [Collinsella sp.]
MGTRFLVADECTVSEQYKEMVLKANDTSTRATGRSTGHRLRPQEPLPTPMPRARRRAQASRSSGPWHGSAS